MPSSRCSGYLRGLPLLNQPYVLEAASPASGKEQLGVVSPAPTRGLSPPLPLSWGALVQELLLRAQPLTQLLMVAPSPAVSIRAFPQESSLLCRMCLRCRLGTSPKCTLARWLRWSGRVLNPGGSQLEVLWAEKSFGRRWGMCLALQAGGCSVCAEGRASFQSLLQGLLLCLNP